MKKRHSIPLMIIVLYMTICLSACGDATPSSSVLQTPAPTTVATPIPTPEPTATPEPTPTPFPEYDINLMMVGDNLMHMGIVNTGRQEDGSYNYDFLFKGIEGFLAEAEIKMINQETILGGNELGFSGYPYFNSPTEVGDAIADAGFNVVLHSSNHTADKKLEGILNCVNFWEQYPEVMVAGIYGEEGKTEEIPLLKIEDITFAVLNYTYGPNAESFPKSYEGHMDMLCDYDEKTRRIDFTTIQEEVLEEIAAADAVADFVIVCPHWGTEYTTKPSSYQKKFARQMAEAGADIIIGTHPHVVQPVEWIEAENGNRALCYYSLGNYVSTQKQALCMLEGMAWITIHVDEEGPVLAEESTGVIPMVCQYKAAPVRLDSVYLLEDYTEEQAASHGIKTYGGVVLKLSDLQNWSDEVFGDWVLTEEQVLPVNQ
ncbi:MAG: CapA family protein [Lachnospiraceae bacterium]|nr:CapA family protein [Lachnospiraceae bacterium]